MSLHTRLYMILQVAQGVKCLQKLNIYHLDLKPANILLSMTEIIIFMIERIERIILFKK